MSILIELVVYFSQHTRIQQGRRSQRQMPGNLELFLMCSYVNILGLLKPEAAKNR